MRFASFLISIAIAGIVSSAGPAGATGFCFDPHSFFSVSSPGDSTTAVIVIRHSECDLGARQASLLTGDLLLRRGPRYEFLIEQQFPAVRDREGIRYGVGDMLLRATARITGDSADVSGLFLRADARIPTGTPALRPFSDALFEAEGGLEARFATRGFDVRAAALYTLVPAERRTADFANDAHYTLAASAGAGVAAAARVDVSAFLLGYDGGETRHLFAGSIGRGLSPQLRFDLAAAAESGDAGSRVFETSVSASLTYRFPPGKPAPGADSSQP